MKTNYPKLSITTLLLAAGVITVNADQEVITKSFSVKPGGKLVMNVDRGSIHITTSDSDKVEIRITRDLKRASAAEAKRIYGLHKIDLTSQDNEVKIEAQNPQKGFSFNNPFNHLQVDYTVAIPSKFDADLKTAGGNIEVADLEGKATVQTSGGNLELGAIKGPVKAHTSGGNITLEKTKGSVKASTSGGDIRVKEAYGPVSAHTSGGNVSANFNTQPTADCSLKTSGGNVDVLLASNLALDLNAHTSGGNLASDFAGTFNKQRTKLTAQINGGGPALVLETSGGNVNIRKK